MYYRIALEQCENELLDVLYEQIHVTIMIIYYIEPRLSCK